MDPSVQVTEQAIVRRVVGALMPLVCIMYLIAYVDRQNVAYAKLQMVGDLHLSETAYGLGASLFFIGYLLFELPSNMILRRVGARVWFARIMLSWGLVTLLLAATRNETMFYVLRFLLGVCEAVASRHPLSSDDLGALRLSRADGVRAHGCQRDRKRDRGADLRFAA